MKEENLKKWFYETKTNTKNVCRNLFFQIISYLTMR